MDILWFGRALLKVLTCTVGGTLAGLFCLLVFVENSNSARDQAAVIIGVSIGLSVGISWAIRQREVRFAFALPTALGLLGSLGAILGAILVPSQSGSGLGSRIHLTTLALAFPVGLFIGIVWSLSRAGAFRNK